MSALTTADLLAWDPRALAGAARSLEQEAEQLHRAALEAGTCWSALHDGVWAGQAARAAHVSGQELVHRLRERSEQVSAAAQVLLRCAAALEPACETLVRALALAHQAGLRVDPDGAVRLLGVGGGPDVGGSAAVQALALSALDAAEHADRQAGTALVAVPAASDAAGPGSPSGSTPAHPAPGALSAAPGVPAGRSPVEVAAWWSTLPLAARGTLERRSPELLGGLEGLPVAVRDRANRALLSRDLRTAAREMPLSPPSRRGAFQVLRLRRRTELLRQVEDQLEQTDGARLLLLDTRVPGRAAVVLGDPDAADHVAVLVAGVGSDVTHGLPGKLGDARRLHQQASAEARSGATVATVAWLGYDAPDDLLQAFSSTPARRAAPALRASLAGIGARAAVAGRDPHVTVVGHSYGSLVTGLALRQPTAADDAVLLGSPGVGAERAGSLLVPAGHVHVAEAEGDWVADLRRFGTDPSSRPFGAREVPTDAAPGGLRASRGHSDYLSAGTASLRGIALVTVGRPGAPALPPPPQQDVPGPRPGQALATFGWGGLPAHLVPRALAQRGGS